MPSIGLREKWGGVLGRSRFGPLALSGAPGICIAVGAGVTKRSLSSIGSDDDGCVVRLVRSHLVCTPSPVAEAQTMTRVVVRRRLRLEGPVGRRRIRACFALLLVMTAIRICTNPSGFLRYKGVGVDGVWH
ncbi:hypothetical protein BDZ94DRAFT_1267511 [Collybia nuda]|uniref:Uncharacterized protein n=1 Tax=Collybia nuda TaxID=64659 RepID=A0A9P5XZY7_9AGAR|nr:hypothetical protein BDZ94DRAFT_1267511 [Collybia nuda]